MALEGDGYYTYDITGFTALPIGVVFNNGATSSTQQTVDLFTSEDKCWDAGTLSRRQMPATEVPCPSVGIANPEELNLNIYPESNP